MSPSVTQLKYRFGAKSVALVGYSGGGAVVALVAAGRTDVVKLTTVAGNLDHAEWTKKHMISPLSGSLNPADYWRRLVDIPQVHYVGGRDEIIGLARSIVSHVIDVRDPIQVAWDQVAARAESSCRRKRQVASERDTVRGAPVSN